MGKNNRSIDPAEFMITKTEASESASAPTHESSPESKPTHRTYGGESRSKKTLIALTPTMFEEAKDRAGKMGVSFNEYVTRLIEADLHGK